MKRSKVYKLYTSYNHMQSCKIYMYHQIEYTQTDGNKVSKQKTIKLLWEKNMGRLKIENKIG